MSGWFSKVKEAIDKKIFSEEHDPYYDSSETDSISSVQETAVRKVREQKEPLSQNKQGRDAGGNNVIQLNPRQSRHEIMVSFAADRKEMFKCADALKSGKSVLVVLNHMKSKPAEMQSIVDFLTGVAYNLDGNRKKIIEGIYLYTPGNVVISLPVELADEESASLAISGAAGIEPEDKKIVPFVQKSSQPLPPPSQSSAPLRQNPVQRQPSVNQRTAASVPRRK
ncbi:MAG: cell division protein SepF [bacterium]|nr:cell division protein SepF [bacterium]